MTTSALLLDRLAPPAPIPAANAGARNWLQVRGLPDAHDEAWRYTPVDQIVARLKLATPATSLPLQRSVLDHLAGEHGGPRLVFVNGHHVPELSECDRLPAGVWCGPLAELPPGRTAPPHVMHDDDFADGFHALNRAAGPAVALVLVGPGVELPRPVHIVHVAAPTDAFALAHPHTVIDLGDRARAHVIETFTGLDGTTITNAVTSIHVGSHAALLRHRIQTEAPGAIHVGHTRVEQATGSDLRSTSVMVGAAIARDAIDVGLRGSDARVSLDGVYLPSGHRRHDTAVTVDHAASRCTSTQRFRGVIDGHARGSFSGRIIVRPDTVATDAQQTNRNLLLSKTAQADSRPWLEILADDVRCNHGATVGRIDDAALFYLRSRGIPVEEGRAMLVDAFVHEITDTISPSSLRDHVSGAWARCDPGARS
jgi:Fe-S cluster assembly protein SufD